MIQIDKKVKINKAPSAKLGRSKYPFADMKVKDSFVVEEGKRYSVSTLAHRFAQSKQETNEKGKETSPAWEFEVKTVLEEGERKLRCIRIK